MAKYHALVDTNGFQAVFFMLYKSIGKALGGNRNNNFLEMSEQFCKFAANRFLNLPI